MAIYSLFLQCTTEHKASRIMFFISAIFAIRPRAFRQRAQGRVAHGRGAFSAVKHQIGISGCTTIRSICRLVTTSGMASFIKKILLPFRTSGSVMTGLKSVKVYLRHSFLQGKTPTYSFCDSSSQLAVRQNRLVEMQAKGM